MGSSSPPCRLLVRLDGADAVAKGFMVVFVQDSGRPPVAPHMPVNRVSPERNRILPTASSPAPGSARGSCARATEDAVFVTHCK